MDRHFNSGGGGSGTGFALAKASLAADRSYDSGISYEGQRVSSVQLAGQPDGAPRRLRALIAQPDNAPYSQAKVDETVAALKKAGGFKDVEVEVTPAAEGYTYLHFEAGLLFWRLYVSQS